LRTGLLKGRLGTDTFVARVDAAYRAKTHDELDGVVDDLPRRRWPWSGLLERMAARPQQLQPPDMHAGESRVLGRGSSCDYAIVDPTVSSRHAELIRTDDGWVVRDLGSRNGTRVNGWLTREQPIWPGDTLTLGTTTFVFSPRA
jgi:hypothetical protein